MQLETKSCIACFEPINVKARKCPHCHQIQTKAAALINHPAMGIAAVSLAALVIAYFGYVVYESFHKEPFSSQLTIGPSTLRVSKLANELHVTCFSEIKNNDSGTWGQPSLQAEFFDQAGKLIDVHYARENFELYPSLTAKGRVSGRPSADPTEYVSCKMSVLSAK